MKLPGVFIGRFQPLHKGHVYALKEVFGYEKHVFVVIGSAQACFTPTNPFTTGERIQMLQAVLNSLSIPCSRYLIVPIPDIHNYRMWVDHVVRYLPPFGKVYTGSKSVNKLFSEQKYTVKEITLHRRDTLSSSEVRRRLVQGENWEILVPRVVKMLIEVWNGQERIRSLQISD